MTFSVRLAGVSATAAIMFVAIPGAAFATETQNLTLVTPQPETPAPTTPVLTTPAPTTPAPTTPVVTTPVLATPGQVQVVPVGAADTGDGSTAPGPSDTLLVLGGMGLVGATAAATIVVVRRRTA